MDALDLAANAACLEREIAWFREVVERRLALHADEQRGNPLAELAPPPLPQEGAPYAGLVRQLGLDAAERLVLLLSYLPHLKPDVLDVFLLENRALARRFTEFGGTTGAAHPGFLPTGETALFLLAGDDLTARLHHRALFHPEHPLYSQNLLRLERRHPEEPALAAVLALTPEGVERLTTGHAYRPPWSAEFPAERITTPYEWDDLVLDPLTREEIEDIVAWVRHRDTLLRDWRLERRLKPGYRALFSGPPGTGKTLTACLLGKATGLPVYRVDLSRVVSKWIGETEKNLASLFDHARHQSWILFFDEAEALFGKRTDSQNANDRAANQQIAYLLQRIEDFPGVVLLATNLRSHLDEAFSRRFQAIVPFPLPGAEQRLRLWEGHFRDRSFDLADDVDLPRLARDHELSGGSILNVLRYACLRAVGRSPHQVCATDLLQGIQRELHKAGRFSR